MDRHPIFELADLLRTAPYISLVLIHCEVALNGTAIRFDLHPDTVLTIARQAADDAGL